MRIIKFNVEQSRNSKRFQGATCDNVTNNLTKVTQYTVKDVGRPPRHYKHLAAEIDLVFPRCIYGMMTSRMRVACFHILGVTWRSHCTNRNLKVIFHQTRNTFEVIHLSFACTALGELESELQQPLDSQTVSFKWVYRILAAKQQQKLANGEPPTMDLHRELGTML